MTIVHVLLTIVHVLMTIVHVLLTIVHILMTMVHVLTTIVHVLMTIVHVFDVLECSDVASAYIYIHTHVSISIRITIYLNAYIHAPLKCMRAFTTPLYIQQTGIQIDKVDYVPQSVLMATPIIFQTRVEPTSDCPFQYSTRWLQGQWEQVRSFFCGCAGRESVL